MPKLVFSFLISILIFATFAVEPVLAQTFKSNSVITKVGDAPEDQKPKIGGSGVKHPAPPAPANLQQAIYDQFNIDLNDFSQQELNWAWEKFWDIQHTKFFELTKGTHVFRTAGSSETKGCSVYFAHYPIQELFNVILIHELGHVIQNCPRDAKSLATKHNNLYQNGKNTVTGYGLPKSFAPNGSALSCFGYPAWGENYAEMITYYLNPNAKEQTVGNGTCVNNGTVPFADGKHQDYFDLAREILGEY